MISQKSSKELNSKAYHTCLPHLVTFLNYSITIFCEITFIRFENLPPVIAIIRVSDYTSSPKSCCLWP